MLCLFEGQRLLGNRRGLGWEEGLDDCCWRRIGEGFEASGYDILQWYMRCDEIVAEEREMWRTRMGVSIDC